MLFGHQLNARAEAQNEAPEIPFLFVVARDTMPDIA